VTPYEREQYFFALFREAGMPDADKWAKDICFLESIRHGGEDQYISTFAARVTTQEHVRKLQGLPVDVIASRAGCSKRTAYRYLQSANDRSESIANTPEELTA
jgi:hypothetical protein